MSIRRRNSRQRCWVCDRMKDNWELNREGICGYCSMDDDQLEEELYGYAGDDYDDDDYDDD